MAEEQKKYLRLIFEFVTKKDWKSTLWRKLFCDKGFLEKIGKWFYMCINKILGFILKSKHVETWFTICLFFICVRIMIGIEAVFSLFF